MGFFQDPFGWLSRERDRAAVAYYTTNPEARAEAMATPSGTYEIEKAKNNPWAVPAAASAAPVGGPPPAADMTQSDAARAQMAEFIAALRAQAAGQGPSMAQGQLQQATDSNIRNAMAMGLSSRGMGYQAQLRNILQNQAAAQQQAAGQSALLRNQEMMQGQQMLGQALGGMRAQDIQQALGTQQLSQGWALGQEQLANQRDASNKGFIGTILNTVGGAVDNWMGTGPKSNSTSSTGGGGYSVPDVEPPTDYSQGMAGGGVVPGQARARGDSLSNDTVPAMLSPGEIVLPRSVAQGEDAPDKAAEFVAALKTKKKRESGEGPNAEKLYKVLSDRLRRVEMAYGGQVC